MMRKKGQWEHTVMTKAHLLQYQPQTVWMILRVISCRNYGGVYVGLPTDMNTVATSQSKSTRKGKVFWEQLVFRKNYLGIVKKKKTKVFCQSFSTFLYLSESSMPLPLDYTSILRKVLVDHLTAWCLDCWVDIWHRNRNFKYFRCS